MKNAVIRGITGLGLIGALAVGGCGTELDEEDVDVSTSAFTASQCARATAAATFTGEYVWGSATNYSTACNAVDETTGGSSLFQPYGSEVNPSKLPTTQSACQSVTIRSTFYTKSGSTWVLAKDESHAGVWGPLPFGAVGCSLPGTSFPPPGGGIDVRVATTVRRPSGSSFVTLPFTTSLSRMPR
jgi:hypothetical protein